MNQKVASVKVSPESALEMLSAFEVDQLVSSGTARPTAVQALCAGGAERRQCLGRHRRDPGNAP